LDHNSNLIKATNFGRNDDENYPVLVKKVKQEAETIKNSPNVKISAQSGHTVAGQNSIGFVEMPKKNYLKVSRQNFQRNKFTFFKQNR